MQALVVQLKTFAFNTFKSKKGIARVFLALLFIVASSMHFITDVELKIIPPFLPLRREALYITGIFEFLGGIGLLIPRFRRAAAWGLAALLVAIFPANIYHAIKNIQLGGILNSPLYHVVRLPLQAVLIWWALWCGGKKGEE
jgi:uncharacterized membrane protein